MNVFQDYLYKYVNRSLYAFGLVLIFFPAFIIGQSIEGENYIELNPSNDLISNENNWYIYKDSREIVWISSSDGVYCYDGLSIKPYRAEGTKQSIRDGNIQSDFYEDSIGDIWFTSEKAINHYQRKKDAFESFQLSYQSDTIREGYRLIHFEKQSGKLWVFAGGRIFYYNTKEKQNQPGYHCISDSISHSYFFAVDTSNVGNLKKIYGFLYSKPGIEIIEQKTENSWGFSRLNLEYKDGSSQQACKIYNGIHQNDNILWLLSNNGLLPFDKQKNEIIYEQIPKRIPGLTFTKGIHFDQHHVLLNAYLKGLWLFDFKTLRPFQPHISNVFSNGEIIGGLYVDQKDRLWFSINNKGVRSIPKKPVQEFRNPFSSFYQNLPESNFILQKDSSIWIASKNMGINVFSCEEQRINFDSFLTDPGKGFHIQELIDFSIDKNNNIWCNGIYKIYRYKNQHWEPIYQIENNRLFQLFHISKTRQMVITPSSIFNLVWADNQYKLEKCSEPNFENKPNFSFTRFFEGHNQQILIPFQDRELWIGKIDQNDSIIFTSFLPFNAQIFQVAVNDEKKITWLGTSNGLAKLDSTNQVTFPLIHKKEIGTSDVFGVLEAEDGRLFFSTNKGIFVFNPKKPESQLVQYTTADGLASEDFSPYAALKASDGKMWFGNSKGLTVFHPDSIGPYPYAPNPYIMDLLVNNVPYQGDTVIGESKRIALSHRDNSLAFQMKAIGYHFSQLNTLQYRLLGYDEEWITIKNGESARFTKITPSEQAYHLEYKAINANGVESPSKFLEIYIAPPLYKRLWFQILVFILLVSLIYAYYRYRIAQIKKEARYKQMIAETETAVLRLQMNPHFIFNSMNSISSYILQKDIHTANDYLGRFARLMRMILDFAAKPLIEVADEVELLTLYLQAETMRFEGRFDFAIEYGEGFDPDEYLIPPMILQPFVENAILHAFTGKKEKGQIAIRFWQEEHSLFCSVEDNGIGRGAAAQQNNKAKTHESKALGITARRMELLEHKNGIVPNIQFTDLVDENNVAMGTRVLLRFPVL